MSFEKHPVFLPPENENQKIWRYMDFIKFVSLLESRSIYFPSQIQLAAEA